MAGEHISSETFGPHRVEDKKERATVSEKMAQWDLLDPMVPTIDSTEPHSAGLSGEIPMSEEERAARFDALMADSETARLVENAFERASIRTQAAIEASGRPIPFRTAIDHMNEEIDSIELPGGKEK